MAGVAVLLTFAVVMYFVLARAVPARVAEDQTIVAPAQEVYHTLVAAGNRENAVRAMQAMEAAHDNQLNNAFNQ